MKIGVETIVDNGGILRLNEKHIKEGLDHKSLQKYTVKFLSRHRKHRNDLVDESKRQPEIIFIHKELAIKVIMACRITAVHKFKTILDFKEHGVTLTKKNSADGKYWL